MGLRFGRPVQSAIDLAGRLSFATPVERERLRLYSERLFDPRRAIDTLSALELVDLKAVGDDEGMIDAPRVDDPARADDACGLFEFTNR